MLADSLKIYTIGYGGRGREELITLLKRHGIASIVDVRLRPDRASLGTWSLARSPDKGIVKVLADAGIAYVSLVELGNVFLGLADWPERYQRLLDQSGDLLLERLLQLTLPRPFCLLCAEKAVKDCHRRQIAACLAQEHGYTIEHLE